MICSDNAQGLGLFIFQQQRIAAVSSLLPSVFVGLIVVLLLGSQGFFTSVHVGAALAATQCRVTRCECLKQLVVLVKLTVLSFSSLLQKAF
jgi:hypothetical protein